jgi:hypothetical protein
MKFLRKWASVVSPVLVAAMIYASVPLVPAVAGIVTTDQLIDLQADAANRDKISDFLTRQDVRRQMTELGVNPSEIESRVAALSNEEALGVAGKIDEAPAGQGAVGVLLVTAVVVFLVFVVTDMTGVTDVFPFDNPKKSEEKR